MKEYRGRKLSVLVIGNRSMVLKRKEGCAYGNNVFNRFRVDLYSQHLQFSFKLLSV